MSLLLLRKLSIFSLLTALILSSYPLKAEPIGYFLPDHKYDASIPTPEEFLGYELGDWHVRHDQVLAYLKLLGKKSKRARFEVYGESWEQKQQVVLIFSSEENQQNLETIRKQRLNPAKASPDSPLITWLGYSIHGNEASGTNASLAVAYYLAASEDIEVTKLLKESVILVDPSFNPDGYSRFSNWVNANKSLVANGDNSDRELNEPWPGARTNHYWFDLNRDWLLAVHPESKNRLNVFHQWHPHVLTDHHEMGSNSSYFFQPGVASRQNPLTPQKNFTLTKELSEFHAKAFDKQKRSYFTEEFFDDFYIGKGSTYPDVNGGIGILFEQASVRGHFKNTANGPRTFSFAIKNHVTSSLSTLAGSLALNKKLKAYQKDFFLKQKSSKNSKFSYVISDESNPSRTKQLVSLLQQHHVQVYQLAKPVTKDGMKINSGYIVPTRQTHGKLIDGIFDVRTKFKDNTFYDVSAWALQNAYDLPLIKSSLSKKYLGDLVLSNNDPAEITPINSNAEAFILDWKNDNAPFFVGALLQAGIQLKVNTKPFSAKTTTPLSMKAIIKNFSSGQILIPAANQKISAEKIHSLLQSLSKKLHLELLPIFSGLTDSGIDLGSPTMKTLKQPSIALITGDNINPYQAGEVRYVIEQKMGLPITVIASSRLNHKQISSYSHIVMVSGKYEKISDLSKPEFKQSLLQWIKQGGTLIAFESGAKWISDFEEIKISMQETTKDKEPPARLNFSERDRYKAEDIIGGAIFETDIDPSHPLAYGISDRKLTSLKTSKIMFTDIKGPFSTVSRYTSEPLISGYASPFNIKMIANSPSLVRNKVGSGQVVLFADDPNFRGYWLGTMRLFSNSLLFSDIH